MLRAVLAIAFVALVWPLPPHLGFVTHIAGQLRTPCGSAQGSSGPCMLSAGDTSLATRVAVWREWLRARLAAVRVEIRRAGHPADDIADKDCKAERLRCFAVR